MAARLGCERLVAIVPQLGEEFSDLDQSEITANPQGFHVWPAALQPKSLTYNPREPFYMADLPGDGLVTQQEEVALLLGTADCASTIMYDPIMRVLALVHIGREGAVRDIGPKVLKYLQVKHGTQPKDVVVHFGSAIAAESYILPRLGDPLQKRSWKPFLSRVEGGHAVDFVGYARHRLMAKGSGIPETNITVSDVDVAANPDYFSLTAHLAATRDKAIPNGRNGLMVAQVAYGRTAVAAI